MRLENVTFSYGGEAAVLEDLTLEARRGEIVALVGPSGGGKTTVLNLIPRFYDVTAGKVTIDDFDVRDVTLASLRRQIALVTQEPFLFDDTIRANIAYAKDDATDAEIEAAARQAAAHDFIMALPKGYDTQVGEAGARLSGGQRQRIAIARAFLKDAPILLLDEATSALDTESEAQVQVALERLMAGRTTIIIAHRLSTVRGADRIYVIDRRPGGGGRRPRPADGPRRPLRPARRRPEPRPRAGGGRVKLKLIARRPWVQSALAWLVSAYLHFTLATMRWRFENRAGADAALAGPDGLIALLLARPHRAGDELPAHPAAQAAARAHLVLAGRRADRQGRAQTRRFRHPRLLHHRQPRASAAAPGPSARRRSSSTPAAS